MALTQITGSGQATLSGRASPAGQARLSGRGLAVVLLRAGMGAVAPLSGQGLMTAQLAGYGRRLIVAQGLIGAYPLLPIGLAGADPTYTLSTDPLLRQTPLIDSKTVILVKNSDVVARTITIRSVLDSPFNRGGDIAYSVAAGAVSVIGPFKTAGWAQSGQLYIDLSSALLLVAVITLP